jgi:hypothetical protein
MVRKTHFMIPNGDGPFLGQDVLVCDLPGYRTGDRMNQCLLAAVTSKVKQIMK